jgi:hypothetical protein
VVRVDMESTKIDFVLEGDTAASNIATSNEGIDVGAWGAAPPKKAKKSEKPSGKAGKRHG